jgi:hypothetical protein
VTFRWTVREATYRFWRALERVFARVSTRVCRGQASFLRFLCENFCRIWVPALGRERLTESGELPEYFAMYSSIAPASMSGPVLPLHPSRFRAPLPRRTPPSPRRATERRAGPISVFCSNLACSFAPLDNGIGLGQEFARRRC